MPRILFATNRQRLADTAPGQPAFGDTAQPAAPEGLLCAGVEVTGIDVNVPDSGTIVNFTALNPGGFTAADLDPVLGSQNDVLVFVHGAANSFQDSIRRAALNKVWLGLGTVDGVSSVCDVIAFSWPARAYRFADIISDFNNYRHDQAGARASAYHFGPFIRQMQALRQQLGNRRLNLLCHSLGTAMLAGTVEALFAGPDAPTAPLFDQVVLAAADEVANTFSTPNGGRLANLRRLGRRITVYFNNQDLAIGLSHIVNRDFRLGYDGPPNAADTGFFPPETHAFVDCSWVNDYISSIFNAPDRSHTYYRQSPTVRADILATLGGAVPRRLKYDAQTNIYALFPPIVVA